MEPWLPGYRFVFTGQLDQFVKIYCHRRPCAATTINLVMSHLKANGYDITPETTLQEIITLKVNTLLKSTPWLLAAALLY